MRKFLLKAVVILTATGWGVAANAVPNYWSEETDRGFWHLDITNATNQGLSIICNAAAGEADDNEVYFSLNAKKDNSWVSLMGRDDYHLLINNSEVISLPTGTDFRLGAGSWVDFTYAIQEAKNIKVYKNNKLVATFTPKNLSVVKELPDYCQALMYKTL